MKVTPHEMKKAFELYKGRYEGRKEDYFALVYLAKELDKNPEDIHTQVAFGGNDYGIDAFQIDTEKHNLYLYQFKWSENHSLFKDSIKRITDKGILQLFGNPLQEPEKNQMILHLKDALYENKDVIDRVIIKFIFNGDSESAERSRSIENLLEDLEAKKYMIDDYFGKQISLKWNFISNQSGKLARIKHMHSTHRYEIDLENKIETSMPSGEKLVVGFIRLFDLYRMYSEMGLRFFERNIRAGLSYDKPANREIRKALKSIVMQDDMPEVFEFNHNGVTLAAEQLEFGDKVTIVEPRLLNGAQTITNLSKFIEKYGENPLFKKNKDRLEKVRVLAKIVYDAPRKEFVTNVTICNNRQNPVEPWNLRSNDEIQCDIQDYFREQLGIYYERQENAFKNYNESQLEEEGYNINQGKPIKIKDLAKTLLAMHGEIDKMSRLPDVFYQETSYEKIFNRKWMSADARIILLSYKIRYRIKRLSEVIVEKAPRKHAYLDRAKHLIWALLIQGLLNDSRKEELMKDYGEDIRMQTEYSDYLKRLSASKIRLILVETFNARQYQEKIEQEKYDFLRTKTTYEACMSIARKRYGWKIRIFED